MYSIDEIIEKASEIIDINDFKSQVNTRQYEIKVTSIAKSIVINKEIYNELSQAVDKYYENNRALSFTLFFILFTMCRRQNYGDYLELAVSYEEKFKEYEIMKHIELMGILAKSCQPYIIYKAIKDASGLVCFKNDNCDFSEHSGVLNAYTELICKYFEHHLDERDGYENKELLKKALDCIKKAIEIEMKKMGHMMRYMRNYI